MSPRRGKLHAGARYDPTSTLPGERLRLYAWVGNGRVTEDSSQGATLEQIYNRRQGENRYAVVERIEHGGGYVCLDLLSVMLEGDPRYERVMLCAGLREFPTLDAAIGWAALVGERCDQMQLRRHEIHMYTAAGR